MVARLKDGLKQHQVFRQVPGDEEILLHVGVPVAAGVLYPVAGILLSPILASAAMAFSSVSVVTNSLRLRACLLYTSPSPRD